MKILDIPQSGKRGQVVAFQSRFGLCLRQWVVPKKTITPARGHMRAVFGGNAHTIWDTSEDESPLGSRLVISRPYILHGAYWYASGYFRAAGWRSVPYRALMPP
ncbi:MAG: hypothetical protein ACLQU3_08715 [Limisphaerales bacterium]